MNDLTEVCAFVMLFDMTMPAKKTIFLSVLALFLLVGLFFVFSNFVRVQKYFEQQKLQAEVREFERPYREDIYGGSTPEETYALRQRDKRIG